MMERKKILGLEISLGSYNSFVDNIIRYAKNHESRYVCVANVHMLMEVKNRAGFDQVVNNADIVTPDGKPLTWALKLLAGLNQDRVAGMDLVPDLLAKAEQENVSVYFYGGSDEMLERTRQKVTQTYPQLRIAGMESPPFKPLTESEELETVNRINNAGANLVFVILGCPKQELWMSRMKGKINAVMVGLGGALPVFVGLQKRAPAWMQSAGFEWAFRLYQEPKRLFRRYVVTNSGFLVYFLKTYARQAVTGKQ